MLIQVAGLYGYMLHITHIAAALVVDTILIIAYVRHRRKRFLKALLDLRTDFNILNTQSRT